jgi:hypothetical protein
MRNWHNKRDDKRRRAFVRLRQLVIRRMLLSYNIKEMKNIKYIEPVKRVINK